MLATSKMSPFRRRFFLNHVFTRLNMSFKDGCRFLRVNFVNVKTGLYSHKALVLDGCLAQPIFCRVLFYMTLVFIIKADMCYHSMRFL
jgi:hypothetical protein